jgi:hypothetical protein
MMFMDPEAGKTPWTPPLTIGRIYFPDEQVRLSSDPAAFGRQVAETCIARARETGIETWMGTNEPDVSSAEAMSRLVAFEREFTQRMNAEGLRCGVFSLSVGWPRQIEGTNLLDTQPLDAFLRTLPTNNLVFLHEYVTPNGVYQPFTYPDGRTAIPYTGIGPSLCKRFEWWPRIDRHKIVVTECGMDIHGRPQIDGWRGQCPPGMNLEEWFARYCSFMSDYMELISLDDRVLGAIWFCAGPGWSWGQYDVLTHWRQATRLLSGPVPELPVAGDSKQTIRVLVPGGDVVTLELEDYLRGVVPAEMGAEWLEMPNDPADLDGPALPQMTAMEALRAQAVLARSYAMWRIEHPRHNSFDLYTTAADQVYNRSLIHHRSDTAVRETKGIYLRDADGKPFKAMYVSACGRSDCVWCAGQGGYQGQLWEGRACQFGTQAMARDGATWQQIIEAYYGTEVTYGRGF